jgi:hypothetical protein
MNRNDRARARRETIVVVSLTTLLVGGVFLYFLLVGGAWFLGMMATLVALTLIGAAHYLIWGRAALDDAYGEDLSSPWEMEYPSTQDTRSGRNTLTRDRRNEHFPHH